MNAIDILTLVTFTSLGLSLVANIVTIRAHRRTIRALRKLEHSHWTTKRIEFGTVTGLPRER